MNKQKIFEKAVLTNDINTFKSLINDRDIFIAYDNDAAIRRAVNNCNYEMVKLLLESGKVDPSTFNSLSFYYSVVNNHIHIVKLLLKDKRIDPSSDENRCIINAISNERWELVNILWKDKRVKNTLKKDYEVMYNKLMEKIF